MEEPAKKKILYMEDDAIFEQFLMRKLEEAGYEVTIARDGEEGLAKFFESQYDLVLLDLMMPKVSGFDVLARRKENERLHNTPVLVLSSLESPEDRKKVMDLGATEFLIKDSSQRAIMDAVRLHLGLPPER